jgi:DNA primase
LVTAEDVKARVLAATDLVELIGQSVKLTRRGRDFVGLCPFHQEKTPSFHVKPDRQFFYCFGCKASGNAIDFVIKRDRVEFKEALQALAADANIELPAWGSRGRGASGSERQVLLEANQAANEFFENQLRDPARGKAARDYLAKRGFNEESIRRFRIGVSPDAWDGLLRSPLVRKFPPEKLAAAGLIKARAEGGGFYDAFRDRLMFPIRDESGRTIGFGGRVMPGSQDPAKYLNTAETPLFSKGRVAFGMDLARQKIVETRTVAVVEGYTDVVMAHQYGASNVVSVLGTAMTADHVRLLKRFADRIVLLFDADNAGDAAVDRAVELFLTQPVEVAIASMPQGTDPDEYLLQHGAAGFQKLLDEAQDALAYKWRQLARQFSASDENLTGQQRAVQAYLDLLASARGAGPIDALRWGAAVARVSRLTQIPVEDLNRRFVPATTRKATRRSGIAPLGRGASVQGNASLVPTNDLRPADDVKSAQERRLEESGHPAERWIMGILLLEPHRWHDVQMRVSPQDFLAPSVRELAEIYWAHQRDEGEPVFHEFLSCLNNPEQKELAASLLTEWEEQEHSEKGLNEAVESLMFARAQAERRRRYTTLAEKSGDEVEELRRLTELARLASERNRRV